MHRSRLNGFIIDCRDGDLQRHAAFWSAALGFPVKPGGDPHDAHYVTLDASSRDLDVELQTVSHPSRVHVDIESDDVEAEVRRLEALGAKRVEKVRTWWVLQAPSGHRFCVVPAEGRHLAANSNQWP